MLGNNHVYKIKFSVPCVVQHLSGCWRGVCCVCICLILSCCFFVNPQEGVVYRLGFISWKKGLAYILSGKVVIMPLLCSRPKSIVIASFSLIGFGRFWLSARNLSIDVNFTMKSLLIPLSNLCLENKYWISTGISWKAWCACLSNFESVQSILGKIWSRDAWLFCGFTCFSSCKLISFWSIRFCIGVCWVSSPGSWGVAI